MKKREIQFLFTTEISCNNIIQLKDGKLILYNSLGLSNIYIYNEKTFQKLYEINMYKIIGLDEKESLKDNDKNEDLNYENDNSNNIHYNKNCIKELDNSLILIGFNKYLVELKLHRKDYNYKIIKQFDDIISDINILPNKEIIIITNKNIIKI